MGKISIKSNYNPSDGVNYLFDFIEVIKLQNDYILGEFLFYKKIKAYFWLGIGKILLLDYK